MMGFPESLSTDIWYSFTAALLVLFMVLCSVLLLVSSNCGVLCDDLRGGSTGGDFSRSWLALLPVPVRLPVSLRPSAEAGACLQLPITIAMFACFWLAVSSHSKVERLHAVDTAINWDIKENANFAYTGRVPYENGRMGNKNFEDVNTFADFWSWFDLGLVPLFWPQGWDMSEVRTNVAYEHCTVHPEN